MERSKLILGHLSHGQPGVGGTGGLQAASITLSPVAATRSLPNLGVRDDDVVIVSALRTPICKAKRGGFKVEYKLELFNWKHLRLILNINEFIFDPAGQDHKRTLIICSRPILLADLN